MFKNHPKGLLGAALSNMGERFGFYVLMAILLLFLNLLKYVSTVYFLMDALASVKLDNKYIFNKKNSNYSIHLEMN